MSSSGSNVGLSLTEVEQAIKLHVLAIERGQGRLKKVDTTDFLNRATVHWAIGTATAPQPGAA